MIAIVIFIVAGGIVGYLMKGNGEGAAEGAASGYAAIMGILIFIILPLALMAMLFRACF